MFDKSAIQALAEAESITAATTAVALALKGNRVTALPSDFKVHDLEAYLPLRQRLRGAMKTSVLADFAAYATANRESGAAIFIDADRMEAVAVLNLGTPIAPGHADNTATLTPKKTAAYTAMLAVAGGRGLDQTTIAEWMEDWREHLTCFSGDVEIAASKAIAAVRKVTIEASRKTESDAQSLSASRSALEQVKATSAGDPLPGFIRVKCAPYNGLADRVFTLRLGVLTSGDKPVLTLRVIAAEKHAEEMAAELVSLVGDAVGDALPAMVGTYSVKS